MRQRTSFASPTYQQGLTLLEVLVSFVLFTLIMLGMTQTLRGVGDTETRIVARHQHTDDIRLTHQFLAQLFQGVVHQTVTDAQQPQGRRQLFELQPDRIRWVGTMPVRPGLGGRYFLQLAAEPLADAPQQWALVLRYQPWSPGATDWPDWSLAPHRVLAAPLDGLSFGAKMHQPPRGENALQPAADWIDHWPSQRYLPDALRIEALMPPGLAWPPFILPVQPTPTSDPAVVRFTVGGGR